MKLFVAAIAVLASASGGAHASDEAVEKGAEGKDRELWYEPPTCLDWLPWTAPAKSRSECCPCCSYKICEEFFDTDYKDYLLIDFWHKVLEYPKKLQCETEFYIWDLMATNPPIGRGISKLPAWFNDGNICAYDDSYEPHESGYKEPGYRGGTKCDVLDDYVYYYEQEGGYRRRRQDEGDAATSTAVAEDVDDGATGAEDVDGSVGAEDVDADAYPKCYGCKFGCVYDSKYRRKCAKTFEDCCYYNFKIGYPDGCGYQRSLLVEEKKNIPHNRRTSEVDGGVAVHVDTEHAERLEWLKSHVTEMKERMDTGDVTREWDPLFQAYFDNVKDITLDCENKGEQGMRCTSTSTTECGKDLIKAHMAYHNEIAASIRNKGNHRVMMSHAVPDSCK